MTTSMNAKSKAIEGKKVDFKPLAWTEYEKLSPAAKETYNKGEREYNYERKMRRKGYGVNPEKSAKRLSKYFG